VQFIRRYFRLRYLLLFLLLLIIAGFITGRRLAINTTRVSLGLPTPIRVAVLSDIHITAGAEGRVWARHAMQEAMRQKPDAILLVGDFVLHRHGIRYIGELVKGLHAPLGVYAVLGNHDHWEGADEITQRLEAEGVQVLTNRSVVIRKGKTRLALVGIDDLPWGKPDWSAAFRNVPKGMLVVLLSHNPDAALYPQGQRAALIISGHTHGGHAWMPNFVRQAIYRRWGIGIPPRSDYGRAHPYGLIHEHWGQIYISSGVIRSVPPRWFTQAEVAILELR
jgi:uncharacterized protein